MARNLDAASGRWPELLQALGGLDPDQLTDTHQPCPACGGTDRYRWDDDEGPGGWFCNQCGGKDHQGGGGTGVDLLMRLTGWSFPTAARRVEQHLGLPGATASGATPAPRQRKPKRPHRVPDVPPPGTPAPALGSAVAQYPYGPDRADPWYWIQRVPVAPKPGDAKPSKLFIHRTWLDGAWHYPSRRDPFSSEWPAPRPVFNLPDLIDHPDAPVLICEGEGKSIVAADLFPDHVCIAWTGGTAGIGHTDWSPLAGRTLTLWPDADDPGRQCMAKLGQLLLPSAAAITIVNPPAGLPGGWDLADAVAEGWTPQRAAKAVARYGVAVEAPPAPPEPPAPPPAPEVIDLPRNAPFVCLGFDDQNYYYQPSTTGQITRIRAGNHTETHFLMLHPEMAYWESLYPSKTGVNWSAVKASVFAAQHRVGIFNADKIRGRGAWWDEGRPVLHLGDRLIVDGQSHSVMKPPPSRFSYQRLVAIDMPDATPLSDTEGWQLVDLASRFHWEVPASGLLLAGWIALAPICGALSWRPHAWLTASAGSGKSVLLERLVQPLLGEMALWPQGVTTEASVRQELRTDGRPVVFDEAESNEQADKLRIQAVLSLARVASSESKYGYIGKGGSDGIAQRYKIRSMFLLCSISTALKQGADQRRFAQLTMRNPAHLPQEVRTAHWDALDADLTRLVTDETGHRLLARSVRMIPIIRESIAVFRRAAAKRFDSQALGDQYGTLLAGAWSLSNARIATLEDAYALIDSNDWQQYRDEAEQPDEERCLQHILQHQLRVEVERTEIGAGKVFSRSTTITRTVWELCEAARGTQENAEIGPEAAEAHLGRIGIRVDGDRLLVSNSALGLRRILADTAWSHSWSTVLGRLPDAQKAGKVRFRGMSSSTRAASLPMPVG
jgi:putative DNA primase/helicase